MSDHNGGGELCLSPQEFLTRAQEMIQLHTNYKPLLDVLMVLLVGVASLLLLYRVVFGPQLPTTSGSGSSPTSTGSAPSRPSLRGPKGGGTTRKDSKQPTSTASSNKTSWNERIGLPKRSSYYSMPFFADTIATKQEFLEGLIELGNDSLEGWLLVKKGVQKGKTWKKRFVVLDANARLKYYANTDSARRNLNIKGSLTVYVVKPADVLMFGTNTLEVRGTLGGTYFFRAEDEMAARKWLCVLTKRAIQGGVPGRNDTIRLPLEQQGSNGAGAGTGDASGNNASTLGMSRGRSLATNGISLGSSSFSSSTHSSSAPPMLKNHTLDVFVADMNYAKEAPMRQLYVVIKFKSDVHDHSSVPVGQTAPKSCEKGMVAWNEKLCWHFHDHICAECDECKRGGCHVGTFVGLPDLMVVHVYEIALRVITTKIGYTTISLRELLGFSGIKNAAMECSWPILSSSNKMLGNLMLKVNYNVALAGGDALTPFLVSSEEERELIGEVEVNPVVKDVKQFFKLLYDNNTESMWEKYREERGETELVVGEWVESKEHGGQIRVLTFRALTHASIGPASTMTTTTQHVDFVKADTMDMKQFTLEVRLLMRDIPYGDCFSVEQKLVVTPKQGGGALVGKLYLGIPFSKGCMFKSKIISATKAGVMASFQILWKHLNEELGAKLGGGSGGGGGGGGEGAANKATSGSPAAASGGAGTGPSSASNSRRTSSSNTSPASKLGPTRAETSSASTPSKDAAASNSAGSGDANANNANAATSRKLVLAQMSSTQDGTIALEEVFENQRMSLFGKWGPNHLLPTDRARFTNRNGDVEVSFEKVVLPPHWVWTSPWKIDRNYTDCDEEGWSYASDFPRFKSHLQRGRSNMKKLGSSVRRRRWIRTMCYVPPQQDDSHTTEGGAIRGNDGGASK